MLSQEEHVEVMALAGRGWTVSAIARHTGLNRRTVRAHVQEGRQRDAHDGWCREQPIA